MIKYFTRKMYVMKQSRGQFNISIGLFEHLVDPLAVCLKLAHQTK